MPSSRSSTRTVPPLVGALDLDAARAGGQRDAQQVHEQARDELAVGADDGQRAGTDVGRGVAELAGQPALRGAERLVEGDELDHRLGASGRGQVEQIVDEALGALGPGRQAPQGLAQLGIALAARLEHDEVAAQERDRLAELMSRPEQRRHRDPPRRRCRPARPGDSSRGLSPSYARGDGWTMTHYHAAAAPSSTSPERRPDAALTAS